MGLATVTIKEGGTTEPTGRVVYVKLNTEGLTVYIKDWQKP